MSKKPGPNHSRAFKDEVALVAVKRKKTLAELVQLSQPDDPVEGPTPRRPGGGGHRAYTPICIESGMAQFRVCRRSESTATGSFGRARRIAEDALSYFGITALQYLSADFHRLGKFHSHPFVGSDCRIF